MSVASGTDTTAELRTLYNAVLKLEVMLRPYDDGSANATTPGRFSEADIDTQITAVSAAITAVNA
jgi:hypothetical protein